MLARIKKVTESGESGASAVEYGLLVAGIAALIIATVFLLGGTLNTLFEGIREDIGGAGGVTPADPVE
jgi:pilus assembly protein Flp/PilA